jgi:hypothetical protein
MTPTTTDDTAERVEGDKSPSTLRVLDKIATHYGAFQYKHIRQPIDPDRLTPSTGEEELRRVISAIELLLIHNEVGVIDEVTGEYRSLQKA